MTLRQNRKFNFANIGSAVHQATEQALVAELATLTELQQRKWEHLQRKRAKTAHTAP